MFIKFAVVLYLALSLGETFPPAQVPSKNWPVPRGQSHELDPYRYDPSHLKQAPASFLEDSTALVVYYGVSSRVEPDGTVETTTHNVTRLSGRKAVESLGEYRGILFDPSFQTITLNEAQVIKPDGSRVAVQPQHVHVRDTVADGLVYDHQKEVVISFPNLEVGDVYEVKWTTRGKSPEFNGHFFTRHSFGTVYYPTIREELRISLPNDRSLRFACLNGDIKSEKQQGDKNCIYRFIANNLPAQPSDTDLPSREELRLQVMCSTFPNWNAVGKWKQQLRQNCWECTKEIREVVHRVTKDLKTAEEKAAALTYWVRKRIRYVSMMSAKNRYTPHQPAEVLANLYGDCKDQAQLLAVMLREIGLPVYLVSLGMLGDGQVVESVPSPWSTHGIVLVQINGKDHWIDTTTTMAAWNFLPRVDRDRVAYVTGVDGTLRVLRTPSLTADENRIVQTTHVRVKPDGTSDCKRTMSYYGHAALVQREAWVGAPPGERRRLLASALQDSNSHSKMLKLKIDETNLSDFDSPVKAEVHFQILQHFSDANVREAGFSDSTVWNRLLAYSLDYERTSSMDLWAPFESEHRYIIELPAAYRFTTQSWNREIKSKWGRFTVDVQRDANNSRRLEILFHTRLTEPRINPSDFQAYRRFHQDVYNNWRVWTTLVQTRDLADVPLLQAELANAPGDLRTAKVLAGIFKEHGQVGEARIIIENALKIAPEDHELWRLLVESASTLSQVEAVYRRIVNQFPDDSTYQIQLATACIQRGKFEDATAILKSMAQNAGTSIQAKAHYQLARIAFLRDKPTEALSHLRSAQVADSSALDNVEALHLQGKVHERMHQHEDAVKAYRRAIALDDRANDVLAELVRITWQLGRKAEALNWLRRYTLAVQGDVQGLVRAASLHLQMERLDDALDLAMQARDLDFHADAQQIIGIVHFRRGNYEQALHHLDRAHRVNDAIEPMIQCCLLLGKWRQAEMLAEEGSSLRERSPALKQILGQIETLRQRRAALLTSVTANDQVACSEAINAIVCAEWTLAREKPMAQVRQLLDRANSPGIEIGAAHALRGLLALEAGDLRQAHNDATKAVELDRNEALAYYVRGRVKFQRMDKTALGDLRQAVSLCKASNPHMLHWYAAALMDGGNQSEAFVIQWLAVQMRPSDVELLEQLQRIEKAKMEASK